MLAVFIENFLPLLMVIVVASRGHDGDREELCCKILQSSTGGSKAQNAMR
jgi:hypothetical protein